MTSHFNNNLNPPNRGLFFYVKVFIVLIVYINKLIIFTKNLKIKKL